MSSFSSERMVKSRGSDAYDLLSKFDAALTNLDPKVTKKTLNRLKRQFKETSALKPQSKNMLLKNPNQSHQLFLKDKNLKIDEALRLPQKCQNEPETEKLLNLQLETRQRAPSYEKAEKMSRMKRQTNNNNLKDKAEETEPEIELEIESPNSNLSLSRESRLESRPSSASSISMAGISAVQSDFIQRRLQESVKSVDDACVVANRLGSLMARLHLNKNQNGAGESSHAKNVVNLSKHLAKLAISMKTEAKNSKDKKAGI